MRAYVCFDDTDILGADRGTGKLVRWFEDELPTGCTLWGVVRQQLLVHPDIPYTSHNSSACAVVDMLDGDALDEMTSRAVTHIEKHSIVGSDPGLCIATESDIAQLATLMEFGRQASIAVQTQAGAMQAASGVHLSGHGGTNDGIIGAAAGVGLTAWGWSGRFIEFGRLRDHPQLVSVGALEDAGMIVLPVDRNIQAPKPTDMVDSQGWLRPRLWGNRAALPVERIDDLTWRAISPRSPKAPIPA